MLETETLILGGGCAGLSLGVRLAESKQNAIIIESRSAYGNDRTWCFWRHRAHRWEHLVGHTWSRMSLSSNARTASLDCAETPYQMIEASAFYKDARCVIDTSKSVQLRLGETVTAPAKWIDGRWYAHTATETISARHVVDTRPARIPKSGDALLWQSFLGDVITCEQPTFDPNAVGLMHFVETTAVREIGGVMFTYVLPFSSQRALVETTVFGPHPLNAEALTQHQARAVENYCANKAHHVERTESGILPMGMNIQFSESRPNYIHAGLMSGGARPSTGYAFQRIQQWAKACTESLKTGRGVIGHAPDAAMQRGMDRLFLRVIRNYPQRAPDMFLRMFGDKTFAHVIRFLSDEGTFADRWALMIALPPAPFLRTLLRAEKSAEKNVAHDQ
jgi:lycopene beta-cyclase